MFDAVSKLRLGTLVGHAGPINALEFDSSGVLLVSASDDRTIRCWSWRSAECRQLLQGHEASVYAVALNADASRLLSADAEGRLLLWDVAQARTLVDLAAHSDAIRAVVLDPSGTRAVSASSDRTVKLWELDRPPSLRVPVLHEGGITTRSETVRGPPKSSFRLCLPSDGGACWLPRVSQDLGRHRSLQRDRRFTHASSGESVWLS